MVNVLNAWIYKLRTQDTQGQLNGDKKIYIPDGIF